MFPVTLYSVLLVVLLSLIDLSTCSAYKTAIVETSFHESPLKADERIVQNLGNFINLMQSGTKENVNIVIFPEMILNNPYAESREKNIEYAISIPEPDEAITPCNFGNEFNEILKFISCEAKSLKLYVALHLLEKTACSNDQCTSDGYDLYNSNVIFDNNGSIVLKKRYSFDERNPNPFEEMNIDYNMTLGQLISYEKNKENSRIFPVTMHLEAPFLIGINGDMEERNFFNYIFDKVQILLVLIAVYFLEMM